MVNSPNLRNRGPLGTVFSNRVRSVRLAGRLTRGFGKAVLLIGLCFVMIYPILFILSSGFKSIEDIYNPSVVWVPQQFSLQAMDVAIRILEYPKALLKTASILVPSVMLQLLTVLLAGYGFARFRFPGRSLFFGVLIFTIIVPVQSYIIPLFVNMKNFDYFGIGSLIGLVTGEPVINAFRKCPGLVTVAPDHALYHRQSHRLMEYLSDICPDIEQVSIDECYMDFTPIAANYSSPEEAAAIIKDGVYKTFGFTVNVGISDKKVLAKMASDFKKPNLVHTLYSWEIQEKIWQLPVSSLFMCGHSSVETLKKLGILTIGD